MRKIFFIFVICCCGLLQACMPSYYTPWEVKPDLLLICMVLSVLLFERNFGVSAGVFAGALKDSLSAPGFGVNTMLFFILACVLWWVSRKIALGESAFFTAAVALSCAFQGIASGLLSIYVGRILTAGIFFRIVVVQVLYTSLLSPVMYFVVRELMPSRSPRMDLETNPW